MKEIKFKQPIWEDRKIIKWHYWGFRDGLYQHPMNQHESYQYTGVKDKSGIEIYDGHICRVPIDYGPGGIKYEIVQIHFTKYNGWQLKKWMLDMGVEIIGHIEENPELLE